MGLNERKFDDPSRMGSEFAISVPLPAGIGDVTQNAERRGRKNVAEPALGPQRDVDATLDVGLQDAVPIPVDVNNKPADIDGDRSVSQRTRCV